MSIVSKKLQSPSAVTEGIDPNFKQVSLLLHGDGTNGAQNNTFVDGSTNNFTITRNGNATQGTFSPFSLAEGQWSNYFDGSSSYFTISAQTALSFGTGDFTLESWVYPTSINSGYATILEARAAVAAVAYAFGLRVSGGVYKADITISGTQYTGSTTVALNTWTHIAVSRSSGTLRIFVNGVLDTSWSSINTSCDSNSSTQLIGVLRNGTGYYFPGYISNFRVVKGTAIYTSDFTTPTSSLTAVSGTSLLTCQSNRFIDNSSNNFTITRYGDTRVTAFSPFAPSAAYDASTNGGSGYFDGSGDYLTTPDNVALELPTQDFTLECFTYLTALPATGLSHPLIQKGYDANTTSEYQLAILNSSGTYTIRFNPSTSGTFTGALSSSAIPATALTNQWNHIAFTRVGTVGTFWFNGVSVGTVTVPSTLFAGSGVCSYGSNPVGSSGYVVTGYLANIRIIKGSAIYTANFTPPTSPLTAISGTSLLLNCTNAGIIDNAGKNDIETVGNAQVSTSVKKYGTGSMAFDGTGDYLSIPNSSNLQLGSGNFTIEFWLYPTSVTSVRQIINTQTGSTAVNYSYAIITNGTSCVYYLSSTGTTWDIANGVSIGTVALNTWYHVALVRNGSTITPYLNGVAGTTATAGTTSLYNMLGPVQIGRGGTTTTNDFTGNLDDFRITKGLARYTSNFTPSTQAFPDQ